MAHIDPAALTRDDARLLCSFMAGEATVDERGGLSPELVVAIAKLEALADFEETTG